MFVTSFTFYETLLLINGLGPDVREKMRATLISLKQLAKNPELFVMIYGLDFDLMVDIQDRIGKIVHMIGDDLTKVGEERISPEGLEAIGLSAAEADSLSRICGTYSNLADQLPHYLSSSFHVSKDSALKAIALARIYVMSDRDNADLK